VPGVKNRKRIDKVGLHRLSDQLDSRRPWLAENKVTVGILTEYFLFVQRRIEKWFDGEDRTLDLFLHRTLDWGFLKFPIGINLGKNF
jgi:hypothetical protein